MEQQLRFAVPLQYLIKLKLMAVFPTMKVLLDFAQAKILDFAQAMMSDFAQAEMLDFAQTEILDFARAKILDFAQAKVLPSTRLRAGWLSDWGAPLHLVLQEQTLRSVVELMLQRFRVVCWLRHLPGHFERALISLMMKQQASDSKQQALD